MNDNIIAVSTFIRPVGFVIQSKQDARRFLAELIDPGSRFTFPDLNDSRYHYTVYRSNRSTAKNEPATIAHERNDKLLFEADLHSGEDAVDLAYKARKSINRHFFSNKED